MQQSVKFAGLLQDLYLDLIWRETLLVKIYYFSWTSARASLKRNIIKIENQNKFFSYHAVKFALNTGHLPLRNTDTFRMK